jgi:hypothetical protein
MFRIAGGRGGAQVARNAALAALVVSAFAALGRAAPVKIPVGKTEEAEVERHYVRYDDGTMTINDFCPVLQRPLGPVKSPIYVNGRPVGFC